MRNLLMKLQESGSLKSSEMQPLQWLFGGSGDMGLNEGNSKNPNNVYIKDYVCTKESCEIKAFFFSMVQREEHGL